MSIAEIQQCYARRVIELLKARFQASAPESDEEAYAIIHQAVLFGIGLYELGVKHLRQRPLKD